MHPHQPIAIAHKSRFSVLSIIGATEKRQPNIFISLIFAYSCRAYKGSARLANPARTVSRMPICDVVIRVRTV